MSSPAPRQQQRIHKTQMKHSIDPKVDCVFKALLGAEENRNLLIHFLNAILGDELDSTIVEVDILNPYNEKETRQEKLSIVDVKARDDTGRLYQIEIQISVYPSLPARMVYTWASVFSKQLKKGKNDAVLKPTYSIWIVNGNLNEAKGYLHRYRLRNDEGKELVNMGGIWVFELPKFHADHVTTEQERWMKLFKDGKKLDDINLPDWMNTPEMRQIMDTMKNFSDQEWYYNQYCSREDYLMEQATIQTDMQTLQYHLDIETRSKQQALKDVARERKQKEAERQAKEAALQREEAERQAKEAERQAKEAALKENEAMKAELTRLKGSDHKG